MTYMILWSHMMYINDMCNKMYLSYKYEVHMIWGNRKRRAAALHHAFVSLWNPWLAWYSFSSPAFLHLPQLRHQKRIEWLKTIKNAGVAAVFSVCLYIIYDENDLHMKYDVMFIWDWCIWCIYKLVDDHDEIVISESL